jgi:hypothetical protein
MADIVYGVNDWLNLAASLGLALVVNNDDTVWEPFL